MGVQTQFAGNLVADPELRYTPAGVAVANVRVAVSDRVRDKTSGEWRQGPATYVAVTVWRQQAEHLAESLVKGDQVIVVGEWSQRDYESREGDKRTAYEVEATYVGVGLSHRPARPLRDTGFEAAAG